ncbi:MAG: tetratricopeptide repeat protein [Candidatus Latescibacterota bacterium]|nr:MAG: tetratricopeptide repeat protein [Candidatus Latescibacterota bacterium]
MLSNPIVRGGLVAAATLAVMAVVFVAVYDWGSEKGTVTPNVPIRVATNSTAGSNTDPSPPADVYTAPPAEQPDEVTVPQPEPHREVTYEEAEKAYHDRRYNEAVKLFTLYTQQKSENAWGYYMLGLAAWKTGDPHTAESAFEQALNLDPRHVKSRLNLSRVLLDEHRPGDALVRIDEALLIDPGSNDGYRLKGRAFRQMGQIDDAIQAYRRAIQINNEDAWSMNNLGLIWIEAEQFDLALPPLARAVELIGDVAIFWNNLGMALEGNGHFRAAQEAYATAVEVDETYYNATMNLARVAEVLEDPDLEPVDIELAAQRFVDDIAGWDSTLVASEKNEGDGPSPDTFVASDADSTADDPDSTP